MKNSLILFYVILLSLCACTQTQPESFIDNPKQLSIPEPQRKLKNKIPIEIKTETIKYGNFNLQTFSTGKLDAAERVILKFPTSGILDEINIKEGQFISKGELICRMDDSDFHYQIQQKNAELDEAKFQKKDLLVKWGGEYDDDQSVPKEILENIHIQTGINRIKKQIEYIHYQMGLTKLNAPFDGIISDIKAKRFQQNVSGEVICTLINNNSFEASFDILEEDAVLLSKGQKVKVKPIALKKKTISATITTINPLVNEQGLVNIKAKIIGNHPKLLQGMNVNVIIEKRVGKYLIIPKSALVIRSNKEVVFSYDPDTESAKWHYVTIAYENENHYAIREGLEEGMKIITEGNNNLDHDAQVRIKNKAL